MTFDELVNEICDRLNLTSDEAKARVGREANARYRRLTSSIGIDTSRFTQVSKVVTVGNRVVTFTGIEKIIAVIDKSSGIDVPLSHITMDEMHITPVRSDPPRKFAVTNVHAKSVAIYLDATPATAYTLYADGHIILDTLSGTEVPDLPESFHDILIYGVMSDEYRKMEKLPLAQICDQDYERRLSDLRMWIAKSAYKDIYQGRYSGKSFRWTHDSQTYWD